MAGQAKKPALIKWATELCDFYWTGEAGRGAWSAVLANAHTFESIGRATAELEGARYTVPAKQRTMVRVVPADEVDG